METDVLDDVRQLAIALRTPIEGESTMEDKRRAEGEFLGNLVDRLQPMLRQSMRSQRILVASDSRGTVALKSDGIFVHVDIADQQDVMTPGQVLEAEPNLLTILNRIEAELVATSDARATTAAMIVRHARHSLELEGAGR